MCEEKWSRSWSRSSEPARADPEKEHSALVVDAEWSTTSEGKPSDEKIVASLADAREEIKRAERLVRSPENALTCALGALSALERRCAALEKESRKSLEDSCCPQGIESSSSSKEEEYVLVTPIKGVSEDGRLILGDRRILSARALKI